MKTKGSLRYLRLVSIAMTLLLLGSFPAIAGDGSEYLIKKGDTLWDISSDKFKDPFLWPKLWKANPQVKNPHLIYPGQKLLFTEELLKLMAEEAGKAPAGRHRLETVRKLEIPDIESRPVPKSPKKPIITRENLLKGGYLVKDNESLGTIGLSPVAKSLLGQRDLVFIETKKPVLPDTKLYVIAPLEQVNHPATGKQLGFLVKILGVVEVMGQENGGTKTRILESYAEIHTGDQLIPFYPLMVPIEPSILRNPAQTGFVVGAWNGLTSAGRTDVVYIDRGAAQGIEVGDLFSVYSQEPPFAKLGVVQVFAVSEIGASAIIKETIGEIRVGDTIKN